MGPIRRIVLIFVAVTVVIAIAVVAAVRLLPETDLIRKAVQTELRSLTGQEVIVGLAKVSISFSGPLCITLEWLSLKTKQMEDLFAAERVILCPTVAALIRGKTSVETITIERFHSSIVRDRDGKVGSVYMPFLNIPPAGGVQQRAGEKAVEAETVGGPGRGQSQEEKKEPAITLTRSIKRINLVGGRIDWIDQHKSPNAEIVIPLKDISGYLRRDVAGTEFALEISARLGGENSRMTAAKLEGSVSLAADHMTPEKIRMVCVSDAIDPGIFGAYLQPLFRSFGQLALPGLRAELNWTKECPHAVVFTAGLDRNSEHGARLDFEGVVEFSEDFLGVKTVQCSAETDFFPLKVVSPAFPPEFPLVPDTGLIKGRVNGTYNGQGDLRLMGTVELEEAALAGKYRALGKQLGVTLTFQLEPDELVVENLEVRESGRLASLRGKIGAPLSANPVLGLRAELSIHPSWISILGIQIPKEFRMSGPIPVQGRLDGTMDNASIHFTGDLTRIAVAWARNLEKPSGKKGSFSVKGTCSLAAQNHPRELQADTVTRLDLAGLRVRSGPNAAWLSGLSVHADAAVSVKGKRIDVKDAGLAVRRGADHAEVLSGKARITDLASPDPRVEGHALVTIDEKTVALADLSKEPAISVKGSTPFKAQFSGHASLLEWSGSLELGALDLAIANVYRKPAGVKGSLKASGRWSQAGLELKEGALTVPGLSAMSQGRLLDGRGDFGWVTVNIETGDLRELVRYSSHRKLAGLSGSFRGTARLTRTDNEISPSGSIQLTGVNFKTEKPLWTLEDLNGTLDLTGQSVAIPGLVGTVTGFAQGQWRVSGSLQHATSLEKAQGRLSLYMGKGNIKADKLVQVLTEAHSVIGNLLKPRPVAMQVDRIYFNAVEADFQVKSGKARTENFRMKGPEITTGIVGQIAMDTLDFDAILGINTMVIGSDTLGRISAIKKFMDQHKDLLVRIPVMMFARLTGPLDTHLHITPLKEGDLDQGTLKRLKLLTR